MSGETSKKSGEIGETISSTLLQKIGWRLQIKNVPIDCMINSHVNAEGNQRHTHGEDQIFLYHSPFHDESTCIVHVSNKNNIKKYPSQASLKTNFKNYLRELQQTMECAKLSQKVQDYCENFSARKNRMHSGLLIWIHNDHNDIEKDIKLDLANVRLEQGSDDPIYLVDNARASFLLKSINDLESRDDNYRIYYPSIGTSVNIDIDRSGRFLPIELLSSDTIPAVIQKGDAKEFVIYTNHQYTPESYKRLIGYGLDFSAGLVGKISIGMPGYNPAQHREESDSVRLAFSDRQEDICPFSINASLLNLMDEG
ncbi:GapS4a family protein [Azospirillum largimobile]